ncbi:tetratricopeptide repeat protein [Dysgonomonas sp. Marseille-P4677]|uniref:tetratricopeptide repeat protein n=1 Tax=Dysgonomonas sp. Marseille-P4677 TaxID=2364790 RepID=UPI001911D2E0|nr:tetratricopeptide repeat protein [Dysgonomonas sp. Marseille-P4677]MBK5721618.1 tetratricopeptide repeat protein [Dysgonomonas sp. Marseille-P4677]
MKICLIISLLLFSTIATYAQSSSEKLIRQGVALHDKGRYKDAIASYEEALKINPTSMSAVYEMSLSYLQLKDYDKAIRYSTKVITANFQPLLMDAYIVKGTALANQGKTVNALNLLNEALGKCGDEYLIHFNLGLCYFNYKDNEKAVQHLRKAIEIDATHASAFLLYAYALNDLGRWVQSFYSFHFFLLLEPNTGRSKDAFGEMYDIINAKIENGSDKLSLEDGVDRQRLYEAIQKKKTGATDNISEYTFFVEASKLMFFSLAQMQNDTQNGLLWYFFVPTYDEILSSGHFDTYCRYVSVAYFPESLAWWNDNKTEVDNFIEWFENGQGSMDDEAEYGDDSDLDE